MRKFLISTMLAAGAVAAASPAMADAGDWIVRGRAIVVAPNEKSDTVLGGKLGVNNAVMPELDFTYMFTNNIGAELILATTKHKIVGADGLSSAGKLGSTWVLPPTLTLQYHFAPQAAIRPYVGAGINYTIFYSEKTTPTLDSALGASSELNLKSSFGYAVQAGVDVPINERMSLNLDVKYIDITTNAHITAGATAADVGVDINPLVFGAGLGFKF